MNGATPERTVTGGGKPSTELRQFRAASTLLGKLKAALTGTYHACNFAKYAHRYLAEAQYRFNRRFHLAAILPRLLRAAVITPPQPYPLIRLAEEDRQSGRTLSFITLPLPESLYEVPIEIGRYCSTLE